MLRRWRSTAVEETRHLGEQLARELVPDGLLLLYGDLGAGKTVLAQGVARGLGIDPAQVQSPTFTIVREHRGAAARLLHVDLYRLDPGQTAAIGLEELLAGPGVKIVEWPERLPFPVGAAVRLRLQRVGEEEREVEELDIARGESSRAHSFPTGGV